jgi:hypothetical protein
MDQTEQKIEKIRWTKTSSAILGSFILILFLIGYVWWPLLDEYLSYFNPDYPIWRQIDWLLIGNFLVMSVLITLNADIKEDLPYLLIALCGGYIIEAWGTQTDLWTYYTLEKPPLWIIPAWPIAALSVKRAYTLIEGWLQRLSKRWFTWVYWLVFGLFSIMLVNFILPSLWHPLTLFALLMCILVILIGKEHQAKLAIFILGSLLGYFLERWGTTRLCWTYYTGGTPPFFTVLAHGMASAAIFQVFLWAQLGFQLLQVKFLGKKLQTDARLFD